MGRQRNKSENRIKTMYGRFETLILKLAMIIHVAKLRFNRLTISRDTMEQAIAIALWHTQNYKRLLSDMPFGTYSKKLVAAEQYLQEMEVVKMRDMQRKLSMRRDEVMNLMDTYMVEGWCEFDEEENCFKLK